MLTISACQFFTDKPQYRVVYRKKNNIPLFPDFTHVDLKYAKDVQRLTRNFPAYSDFNFVSLYSWDINNSMGFSMLNDNLVIRFNDYIDRSSFYSFIGKKKLDDTAKELLEYSEKTGGMDMLKLVPEKVALKLNEKSFEVKEDIDNFDYMLSVDELVKFRTNKFRGKKNVYNRFDRFHGDKTSLEIVDLDTQNIQEMLLELFRKWELQRSEDHPYNVNEYYAVKKLLQYSSSFVNTKVVLLKDEVECVGFIIFEYVNDKVAILHYDKANRTFVGAYEYMKHALAKHLDENGIELLNYEQDLGIEGLRRAKTSYHPVDYLKKYTVSVQNKLSL